MQMTYDKHLFPAGAANAVTTSSRLTLVADERRNGESTALARRCVR